MLDEGVGSSLKTHLQEVLPICKGEQSLTFKRHQGSTADVQTLKIVLSHRRWEGDRQLIYYHRCLKITKRFELEHQWHNSSLNYFTLKQPWSWNTENLDLLLFFYQKSLACYRNNQLPVREGDTRGTDPWGSKLLMRPQVTIYRYQFRTQGAVFLKWGCGCGVQGENIAVMITSTNSIESFIQNI